MKKFILSTAFLLIVAQINGFAQLQYYYEDFDDYISGAQLACQDPLEWTTWNYLWCSSEDPDITTNYSYNNPNSVVIIQGNNLVKELGNYSTGGYHITAQVYIPNAKSGYISLLSKFNPGPIELAFECYFDSGGTGRLMNIPGEPVFFDYTNDQWHLVWIVVNFNTDEAQFWIDNNLIHIWEWTQNGSVSSQLAAQNFYGPNSSSEMYFDDYLLFENNCLQCLPPSAPTNLIAQQIFNTDPIIQLNWQHSIYGAYAYEIIRKVGFPSDPREFVHLDYVPFSNLQYLDSNIVVDSTYSYGVLALNPYGYSDTSNFATVTVEPVPVEFVSFTFNLQSNNVQLNWTTATETNNKGFEILRRVYPANGGTQNDNDWQSIGYVDGNGTTTEPQFYSFINELVQSGQYQYRLKQIDFDGSFEYSKILGITIEAPNEFSLEQNYPNPFNPTTKIKYTILSVTLRQAQSDILVTLKVFVVLGNEVATLVNEEKPTGSYEVEFSAKGGSASGGYAYDLPSGIYFYQLAAGNFLQTKKMVLLK